MIGIRKSRQCGGFSLIELLAVIMLLGVLAVVVISRTSSQISEADRQACFANQGNIELQVQLWRRNTGTLPSSNLSAIGTDTEYFPEGLPVCPVDGSPYTIDTTTGLVTGHTH